MEPDPDSRPRRWCPKSGQLLGVLVQAFRLDDEAVGGKGPAGKLDRSNRTVKDYFSGGWVGAEQRARICHAAASALLNSGVVGEVGLPTVKGDKLTEVDAVLAAALIDWLSWWDLEYHAAADLWPDVDLALATFVLARPLVIDASLRWTSLLLLRGESAPREVAHWTERSGGAELLRALLDEHWPGGTLDQYATAFLVHRRTVDHWLSRSDPLVPSEESFLQIAKALATISGANERLILVRLRREYGMFALLRSVADVTGWRLASKLGAELVQLTRYAIEDFGDGKPTEEFRGNHARSLRLGVIFPRNAVVLDELLKRDLGLLWVDDVAALRDGRLSERLSRCLRVLGSLGAGAPPEPPDLADASAEEKRTVHETFVLWAMNDNRPTPESIAAAQASGKVLNRIQAADDRSRIATRTQQAEACMAERDFRGAIPHLTRVVELDPTNARYRFTLGAALWQAGEHERGMDELRESCRLDLAWDRPFVELAIAWLNRGMADQALFHLQSGEEKFRGTSDHFNYTEGLALRALNRIDEALAAFVRATELNPKHALAFDCAADCAFKAGHKVEGGRLARQAYHLGQDRSYRTYREFLR